MRVILPGEFPGPRQVHAMVLWGRGMGYIRVYIRDRVEGLGFRVVYLGDILGQWKIMEATT